MSSFIKSLIEQANYTETENGAIALKSTSNSLLDLFGTIGSLRTRSESDINILFSMAYAENNLLATKILFYARDIRGGLGERDTFRIILKQLSVLHPEVILKNISNIPYFGRWDDLYCLIGTPCEEVMWQLVSEQLKMDVRACNEGLPLSLLAKWLKSVKTSSSTSNELGRYTAKKLGLSQSEYRKILSRLRNRLQVVEVQMSNNEWMDINYSHTPSRAMNIYRDAFSRHDELGFDKYLTNVTLGNASINSSTLYPYDITSKILYDNEYSTVLEEQWKALPNYIEGENDVIIMADTSGSMYGRPLATSVGLAIYFAERNKGAYKNTFMTFSSNPSLVQLKGSTLYEKVHQTARAEWGMSTNFEKAMQLILNTAVSCNVSPADLPKSLVVISDMEFNASNYQTQQNWSFYDHIREQFEQYGYIMPNIVFWNVDARQNVFHSSGAHKGVQLASGSSPAVFKMILNNLGKTPFEAMMSVLNDSRYDCILVD